MGKHKRQPHGQRFQAQPIDSATIMTAAWAKSNLFQVEECLAKRLGPFYLGKMFHDLVDGVSMSPSSIREEGE
jgi:hypothetical protein